MLTEQRYVPAAGRAWLTALHDPLMGLTMRERAFRPALVAAVLVEPRPSSVLDVGCGTGTLVAQTLAHPDSPVGDQEASSSRHSSARHEAKHRWRH